MKLVEIACVVFFIVVVVWLVGNLSGLWSLFDTIEACKDNTSCAEAAIKAYLGK